MSASRGKIDFVFDHIVERPETHERFSATSLVLLGLLAITLAAALFDHGTGSSATYRTADAAVILHDR